MNEIKDGAPGDLPPVHVNCATALETTEYAAWAAMSCMAYKLRYVRYSGVTDARKIAARLIAGDY